jgi:hypothetical protein
MATFPDKHDTYGRTINGVWFVLEKESGELHNDSERLEQTKKAFQEEAKQIRKSGRKARVILSGDQYHSFRTVGLFVEADTEDRVINVAVSDEGVELALTVSYDESEDKWFVFSSEHDDRDMDDAVNSNVGYKISGDWGFDNADDAEKAAEDFAVGYIAIAIESLEENIADMSDEEWEQERQQLAKSYDLMLEWASDQMLQSWGISQRPEILDAAKVIQPTTEDAEEKAVSEAWVEVKGDVPAVALPRGGARALVAQVCDGWRAIVPWNRTESPVFPSMREAQAFVEAIS